MDGWEHYDDTEKAFFGYPVDIEPRPLAVELIEAVFKLALVPFMILAAALLGKTI